MFSFLSGSSSHCRTGVPAVSHPQSAEPARTVLIVDDEEMLRHALRRYFTRQGWAVLEDGDGDAARRRLLDAGEPVDLVIADRYMPGLDGIALWDALHAAGHPLATRFILASGDSGDASVQDFARRTGRDVVAKPFALAAILEVAERVLAA